MLPDKKFHDGPIINVGSEDNFKYFEHSEKQNHTQFLVVEIIYEAVSYFYMSSVSFHTSFGTIVGNPTLGKSWSNIPLTLKILQWSVSGMNNNKLLRVLGNNVRAV